MNKKLIRLTEGDLHRIVKESVNRILRENDDYDRANRYFNGYDMNDYQLIKILTQPELYKALGEDFDEVERIFGSYDYDKLISLILKYGSRGPVIYDLNHQSCDDVIELDDYTIGIMQNNMGEEEYYLYKNI
jgi:hypothetical protein